MAFRIASQSGKKVYNLKEFVVDIFDDIEKINTRELAVGSTAFVIDTSETYMLNSKKEWIKVTVSSSGGGIVNPEEYEIIWDGGSVSSSGDTIYEGGGVKK